MKILITGGAGFIGSHLVDRLIKENQRVTVIDNLSTGKKENLNPKAKLYRINICSSRVDQIFKKEKPEVVFHLAAQIDLRKSVEKPTEDAKINILGSSNILDGCRKNRVKKIIFTSTGGAIYGDVKVIPTPEDCPEFPLSPYGIEKLIIEKYLNYYHKVFGLPYIALRLANVYGPRQNSKGEAGVVAIFTDKMLSGGQPVINGSGCQTRDFVYVDDVVQAAVLGMKSKKSGIFNIGTAKETNINAIFSKLRTLVGSESRAVHTHQKAGEQRRSCLDFSKAKMVLGWYPTHNLDNGLEKTVRWFRLVIRTI